MSKQARRPACYKQDAIDEKKEGRINLKELGLVPEEQEAQGGQVFVKALKNMAARFRPDSQDQVN